MAAQNVAYIELRKRIASLERRIGYEASTQADLERQLGESRENQRGHTEMRDGFVQILKDAGQPIENPDDPRSL